MLSDLLGAKEQELRYMISKLESASGHPRSDIRLGADIMRATQEKIRQLGLDPFDTSGTELYEALHMRLLADNDRLMESIGLAPDQSHQPNEILSAVSSLVRHLDVPLGCLALKTTSARAILKRNPPLKTMKLLGYRSLESLLKREQPAQLIAAARIIETAHWRRSLVKEYKKLTPAGFEQRSIEVFFPRTKRWEIATQELTRSNREVCLTLPELGAVVVLPISTDLPALAITSLLLILDGMNAIRSASALFKLRQVKADFGSLVADSISGQDYSIGRIAGRSLSWQVMQYHYSRLSSNELPLVFEPHVQPEDLRLISMERALAKHLPALEFWEDTDNLAYLSDRQPVSLNMLDVALCSVNRLGFSERVVNYVRSRVWRDLLERYLNAENLEEALSQLGDKVQGEFADMPGTMELVRA
jgi:hypothetical protein